MRCRRGSALVVAVLIMALLLALTAATAVAVRTRAQESRERVAALQGLSLAQAAVRLAEATLRQDDTTVDTLHEEWALLGDSGNEVRLLGPGWFRVQILDASARVNVNTAPKEQLMRLPGIDDALSDAILDWRETGETPRPAGAKADYYLALEGPYLPREAAFETIGELLLVRDLTPAILYGPPLPPGEGDLPDDEEGLRLPLCEWLTVASGEPNVSSTGEQRVDLNTATAEQLTEVGLSQEQAEAVLQYRAGGGEFTSIGDLLAVPGIGQEQVRAVADRVTTSAEATLPGRINVNTAPQRVLQTIPGVTPEAAAAIVAVRDAETGGFTHLGELLDSELLDAEAFRQAAGYLGTRSTTFLVRAMGRVPNNRTVTAVEALIERSSEGTRMIRWGVVERAPGWIAWGWTRQVTDPETGEAVRW